MRGSATWSRTTSRFWREGGCRRPPFLPSSTLHPSPGDTAEAGVGGTGLVFWNSCSRRWARLECGIRLRTRTFMETCCWRRRRRRRRQPEGSRRLERRPECSDPCPQPGAGRAQPLGAQRGLTRVAGSRQVRGAGGTWGGGGGDGDGSRSGAGAAGRRSPRACSPRAPPQPRGAPRSLPPGLPGGSRPSEPRPAGRAECRLGSAWLAALPAAGSGCGFLPPPLLQLRLCPVGCLVRVLSRPPREERSESERPPVPSLSLGFGQVKFRGVPLHVPWARFPSPGSAGYI